MPSLEEGFGIPALEALELKTPVIAFPVPSLVENFSDSIWYADNYSADALVKVIKNFNNNTEDRKRRVVLGKEIVKEFSINQFSKKVNKAISTLTRINPEVEKQELRVA